MANPDLKDQWILVTGAARRIGAAICTSLHGAGANIAVHYRSSKTAADDLCERLNAARPDSAVAFQADLIDTAQCGELVENIVAGAGRLDGLINNASTFYPTPIDAVSEEQWDDLVGSNFKAPLFLASAAAPHLRARGGVIEYSALIPLLKQWYQRRVLLGLLQMALGYAIIVWGASQAGDAMIPLIFLCLMYLLHTTGELSLSPVGLSVVTKLVPAKIVGFVMGTWFLSIAFAHKIAGELGKMTAKPEGGEAAEGAASVAAYTDVYWEWGVLVVLGSSFVLFVLSPLLKKWSHGVQ